MTVSDPRFTPEQKDKGEMFKYFHSTLLNTWKEDNDFANFKNANNKKFKLEYDFSELYGSKQWYVPNATTQDLR